jgi:putative hemin transport protein
MNTVAPVPTSAAALRDAWRSLRASEPRLRIRDAASRLGATEAQLLATGCGDGVVRLDAPWATLLTRFAELGPVMALTRNDDAVIETDGAYSRVEDFGAMGQVLDPGIDLRLFLHRWKSGFAVREEARGEDRRSFHFFDAHGTAVHKVYLRDGSDAEAWARLVAEFASADQEPEHPVEPARAATPERPDAQIDRDGLRAAWEAMQDTHEFFGLLGRFGVARPQALRLVGRDLAFRVPTDALQRTFERCAAAELPVMIFVGSPGVIQIHTGAVHRLVATGPWFNVIDPGLDLHVRADRVAAAWVVRKPTADGHVSALELFNAAGETILLVCGKRKPGQEESGAWRGILAALPEQMRD